MKLFKRAEESAGSTVDVVFFQFMKWQYMESQISSHQLTETIIPLYIAMNCINYDKQRLQELLYVRFQLH